MASEAALRAGRDLRRIMQAITVSDDPGDASDVIAALPLRDLTTLAVILPELAGEVNRALQKHLAVLCVALKGPDDPGTWQG